MQQVMEKAEDRPLRVMFQDEGRFGLISEPRGCWAPPGIRPNSYSRIVREYTYAYAAVSPADGVMDSLVLPYANTEAMSIFLAEVGSRHPEEFIGMFCDQAGWHKSKDLKVPENIVLLPIPPRSPELNPSEHLWEHLRENWFCNEEFDTMGEVEEQLCNGLRSLEDNRQITKKLTNFHWIQRAILNSS